MQLLHEKGIPHSEVDKIPASGPKGRLLKGDVLAYLGAISSSYSSDQSARISKLAHLDLGNIQIASPPKMEHPPSKSSKKSYEIPEPDTEVAVSISLTAVVELQKRIQSTLGTTLPLSTFISRAIEVANDNLPRSRSLQPSTDELFNQILGLDSISSKSSRGGFIPQIIALPSTLAKSQSTPGPSKPPDIIELLTAQPLQKEKASRLDKPPPVAMVRSESGVATNLFTVSVKKGDEMRARVFLERVKTALQVEPGSLVL